MATSASAGADSGWAQALLLDVLRIARACCTCLFLQLSIHCLASATLSAAACDMSDSDIGQNLLCLAGVMLPGQLHPLPGVLQLLLLLAPLRMSFEATNSASCDL